ncbi:MAG: Zn-ribbon domain-containing OB-fold protein [Acidimicrobiales bacterium]
MDPGEHVNKAAVAAPALLVPVPDEESAGFWDGAAAGELRMQACTSCGLLRFPPRVMCPSCRSTQRRWQPVSGRGTVWSFVVPHPPLLPAYAALAPYNVIVVTLAEDPALRLVGNLVAAPDGSIDEVDASTIEIGEPVRVVFSERAAPDGTVVVMPEWVRDAEATRG